MLDKLLLEEDRATMSYHRKKYAKYYAPGVLKLEKHYRLVEDLERYARAAGITPYYIYKIRMAAFCTDEEIDYVKHLRQHEEKAVAGLAYHGTAEKIEDRMMSIAGAVLRNLIQARVIMLQDLLNELKDEEPPQDTMVLVPNFFIDSSDGGKIPDWKVSLLVSWVMSRFTTGKQTVLYIDDLTACGVQYGSTLVSHLKGHYYMIEV